MPYECAELDVLCIRIKTEKESDKYKPFDFQHAWAVRKFLQYHVDTPVEDNILHKLELPGAKLKIWTFQLFHVAVTMANTAVLTLEQQVQLAQVVKLWLYVVALAWDAEVLR